MAQEEGLVLWLGDAVRYPRTARTASERGAGGAAGEEGWVCLCGGY